MAFVDPARRMAYAKQASSGELERDGFELIPGLLDGDDCNSLVELLEETKEGRSANRRNLLEELPPVLDLARRPDVRSLLTSRLGAPGKPVRAILFDKTPQANWPVRWHQDQVIPVA